MEENPICVAIRNAWIPIAMLSIFALLFLIIKLRREKDFLEKDRIESKIKYPVILLIAAIISMPLWELVVSGGILPFECTPSASILASMHTIRNFSDGSTEKNVTFMIEGGFNSEVGFKIPYNAKVTKTIIDIEHPPNQTWSDEFHNLSFTSFNDGISINENETYAFIGIRVLDVNGTTVLDGKQVFDDITVRKGGILLVGKSRNLDLIVRGIVRVDTGGQISADGIPEITNPDYSTSSSAGESKASGGGGGGHGGTGGAGGDEGGMQGGEGGPENDLEDKPLSPGQNGAYGEGSIDYPGSGLSGSGGLGGGFLRIRAKRIMLDGSISSNGGNGVDSAESDGTAGGGGGAGGSIQLITDNLALNGQISAKGGNGGNDRQKGAASRSDGSGGGGGGGRISVIYNKKGGDEIVYVEGGKGGKSNNPAMNGGDGKPGTVHWENNQVDFTTFIYGNITSIEIKPDNLKRWVRFYANSTTSPGSDIEFSILSDQNSALCKINKDSALAGYDISECTKNEKAIKLHADLNTVTFIRTPKIFNWKVDYESEIVELTVDIGQNNVISYKNNTGGKAVISDENTIPRISDEINKALKDCSCRGCTPTADSCNINIRFGSNSSGLLKLENPYIEYYT